MGRRLALYSDILEKMSLGIDEYLSFYKAKIESYTKFSSLKTNYENAKNGYEACLMINYDKDSRDFHEKNMSKIKTEMTVLQQTLYPIMYSNNKVKSTFQRLFFIPYAKRNRSTSVRIDELDSRLKKSQEAFNFYNNKYELGCNYLKVLGFENEKSDVKYIKQTFDNSILEFNDFILTNGKYFESFKDTEDFYKASKSSIEDELVGFKKIMSELEETKEEFNTKKGSLENVNDAKKLLSEINQKIMTITNNK